MNTTLQAANRLPTRVGERRLEYLVPDAVRRQQHSAHGLESSSERHN